MHFFRRLRRFLAFVSLGAAGMLVLDGDPPGAPASSPGYSAEQSFIGEVPDGAAPALPTAPSPEAPAPESARAPAEQDRTLPPLVTALGGGVTNAPVGAGIALPLLDQAPSAVTELETGIDRPRTSVDRLAPERLLAELTARLYPAPPRLDAMRLSHNGLALAPPAGRHPAR